MRRLPGIARFVAIQALVLLLVAEVGLRLLQPHVPNLRVLLYLPSISGQFESLPTVPDLLNTTIVGFSPYSVRAGFVTNSRGFRSPEYTEAKPPGTTRIVVIGDSFAFSSGGIPWSDGWQHHLQTRLQHGRTDRIELVNLGVPGVGPLFEQRLWQLEGSRLDPDVLLLVLFVGNDFTDHFAPEIRSGALTKAARASYAVRIVRNLVRLRTATAGTPLEVAEPPADAGPRPTRGGYEVAAYREAFATREPWYTHERLMQVEASRARLCDRAQAEAFDDLFARMAAILRDFHSEVEAAGVDFRVVVLPDRIQVNLDERAEAIASIGMHDAQFDWDKPQRRLRELFEAERIVHLDLLPAFRDITRTEPVFDVGNTHWNVRGNEFVAERLAAWLAPQLPAR